MYASLRRPSGPCPEELALSVLEQRLESGKFKVPLLPSSAQLILRAATQASPDIAAISAALHRDAAIASHVLRLSNSSVYRGAYPIVSLDQAVVRLGAKKLQEIALIVGCKSIVLRADGYESDLRRILRHGFATALTAQSIARTLRQDPEQAFLQGLIHDVGELVVIHTAIGSPSGSPERSVVLRLAEQHHTAASIRVVEQWELMTSLCDVIAAHHDPQPPPHVQIDVRRLQLAEELVSDCEDADRVLACVECLEIYPDMLDTLRKHAEAAKAQAEETL